MSGDIEAAIRDSGLRCTAQRVAVLTVLRAERSHLLVEEIADRVRDRLGTVSTQAIYDVLDALSEVRLVRRIEPAGSPARYEACRGEHHHHLVCRRCGAVADVVPSATTGSLQPTSTHGYLVDEAEVLYWGLCPACQHPPT